MTIKSLSRLIDKKWVIPWVYTFHMGHFRIPTFNMRLSVKIFPVKMTFVCLSIKISFSYQ